MRRGKTTKARFAAALALVMAVTMAAPAMPAYAQPNVQVTKVNYRDHSEIWFDTGIGPGLEHSKYGYAAAVSSDGNKKKTIEGEPVFVFAGQAGVNLTDQSSTFQGIDLEEARQGENRGGGTVKRPKLPEFDLGENGWPGYTFDGWYEKNRRVDNLPPQFYYETPTIYTAKWKRDSNQTFQLTVMHYRDLDAVRNKKHEEDPAAWIQDSNAESIHAFKMQGSSWSKEKSAEDLITDTYRRDIPGYQFQDAMIKNNRFRRYGEASGQGTVHPDAAELNASNNLKGSMPNDNLTVAYRYKPNEDQKFSFRIEYRDMNGAAIKNPELKSCAAETEIHANPAEIAPYIFKSAKWVIDPEASDPARGVYSAKEAGCTLDPQTGAFRGTMPNQRVTICYQYAVDPNFKSRVHVTYLDNHDNLMTNIPGGSVQDHSFNLGVREIPAPKIAGYQYPPYIEILPGGQISKGNPVGLTEADPVYRFSLGTAGGAIKVHYLENLNDTACWARISYVKEGHGTIAGKLDPRSFRIGEQTLEALIDGITVQADPHYEFAGWYQVDPRNPAGRQKLNQTIRLDRNLQLIATFKKKQEDWFRLQFLAGANGRLLENQPVEVERGTKWGEVPKPETEPANALYQFAGWYDEKGNKMEDPDAEIEASQTYTARFTNPNGGTADDPLLAIPDASGAVLRNGSGEVTVHSPNENRRYALTDSEGTVLSVKTGSELVNGRFTGLPVCSQYLVYELEFRVNSRKGAKISELDQGNRSQPASVVVPALGENYRVENDRAADQKKITVNPAAPDTRYALLDAGGKVVSSWSMPEGTSQAVVFAGLAPNTVYTVVAKSASGTEEPSQKQPMGSTVAVAGPGASAGHTYPLQLFGGKVTRIERNGTDVEAGITETKVMVQAGDKVRIQADAPSAGLAFKAWRVLIGDMEISHPDRQSQMVTMPAGAVVLQAAEEAAPDTEPTLDYTPKDGNFALHPDFTSDLLSKLVQVHSDQTAQQNGNLVSYTVQFNKGSVPASVSDAIKTKTGEEELTFPWSLTIGLKRAVNGVNRRIASGSNAQVRVLARVNETLLRYGVDYHLYKEIRDQAGDPDYEEIPMDPDPNEEDSPFDGVFRFSGNIGDTVVLRCSKAYTVTIHDTKRGTTHTLKVPKGKSLEEADQFRDVWGDLKSNWRDPVTGIEYELEGLKKGNPASASSYDPGDEVRRNLKLYAVYAPADDAAWQAAQDRLRKEIDLAHALSNNGTLRSEDRDELAGAVSEAVAVLNRIPRPTRTELDDAYQVLKEVVDRVRSDIPNPSNPSNPSTPSTPPDSHGGSGGRGGSGGSGGSGGAARSMGSASGLSSRTTYSSGTDGNWDNFDPAGHGWRFVTTGGKRLENQWADIVYTYGGVSKTFTYHFGANGVMDSGWYQDSTGKWYFLSTDHNGWFGGLTKGWHLDASDGNWYYLNLMDGAMLSGWQEIDGVWYFLNPHAPEQTWFWNQEAERWEYRQGKSRPFGAMYRNEMTPDGYPVDDRGAWIRETP